jgi:hypothetical protein
VKRRQRPTDGVRAASVIGRQQDFYLVLGVAVSAIGSAATNLVRGQGDADAQLTGIAVGVQVMDIYFEDMAGKDQTRPSLSGADQRAREKQNRKDGAKHGNLLFFQRLSGVGAADRLPGRRDRTCTRLPADGLPMKLILRRWRDAKRARVWQTGLESPHATMLQSTALSGSWCHP